MRTTIQDRQGTLGARLQQKLDLVARLLCDQHRLPVVSLVISARENGWFDCRWTTCCDALATRAAALLGTRCP